jgi:hypothetical protein
MGTPSTLQISVYGSAAKILYKNLNVKAVNGEKQGLHLSCKHIQDIYTCKIATWATGNTAASEMAAE